MLCRSSISLERINIADNVCVCVCVCMRVRACVRACVCVYVETHRSMNFLSCWLLLSNLLFFQNLNMTQSGMGGGVNGVWR